MGMVAEVVEVKAGVVVVVVVKVVVVVVVAIIITITPCPLWICHLRSLTLRHPWPSLTKRRLSRSVFYTCERMS